MAWSNPKQVMRFPYFKLTNLMVSALAALLLTGVAHAADERQEYRLGPGDRISVTVFGEPDLSLAEARVAGNGTVSYPLLGEINVRDVTARDLEIRITQLLQNGYLRKPLVNVTILEYRPFYVHGEVKSPGGYAYKEGMTIEKAVAVAGGFTAQASKEKIFLAREGTQAEKVKVSDLNTALRPGDVVTVNAIETSGSFFYVAGEVKSPGGYTYREGLTVEKALVLAGGLTARASKRKIKISRGEGSETESINVEMSTLVKPGDVINVGESFF